MKKCLLVLLIMFWVVLFFSCQREAKESSAPYFKSREAREIALIAQAVSDLLSKAMDKIAQGEVASGAESLLDAILLLKPVDQYGESENKMLLAKEQFRDGNFAQGSRLAAEALDLMRPGREQPEKREEPQKEGGIAPLAEIVKGKILKAQEQFKEGNAESGAQLVLEALVLLVPRTDQPR